MKAKKIKPLADFVLVERVVHDNSGLIVPDLVKDDSLFSLIVVDVGDQVSIGVKPDDEIWCVAGVQAVSTDIENHFLVKQDSICGVIEFKGHDKE